jgi:hypothetical protein
MNVLCYTSLLAVSVARHSVFEHVKPGFYSYKNLAKSEIT